MGNKGSSHSSTLSRGQGATSDIRDALASLPGSAPTNKTGRYFPQRPGSATTLYREGGKTETETETETEKEPTRASNLLRTRLINLAAAHLPLGAEGVVLASLMHFLEVSHRVSGREARSTLCIWPCTGSVPRHAQNTTYVLLLFPPEVSMLLSLSCRSHCVCYRELVFDHLNVFAPT